MDLKPNEIASKMSIRDFTTLCLYVESHFSQRFGVISIAKDGTVVVELDDRTRRTLLAQDWKSNG